MEFFHLVIKQTNKKITQILFLMNTCAKVLSVSNHLTSLENLVLLSIKHLRRNISIFPSFSSYKPVHWTMISSFTVGLWQDSFITCFLWMIAKNSDYCFLSRKVNKWSCRKYIRVSQTINWSEFVGLIYPTKCELKWPT